MPDEFDAIDWSVTTWEGSRREQMRRWSELTFDEILRAQEEMAELAAEFWNPIEPRTGETVSGAALVREEPSAEATDQ
jgi:hypothetical protein